jgi:hypothetical protein
VFFYKGALFNERYNDETDSTIFTMLDCDESWWQQKAWLIRGCYRIKRPSDGVGAVRVFVVVEYQYDEKEGGKKNKIVR